jgi:phenylacetate-CoA ligase
VWNAPLRQLYLSSYHLAPEFVPAYLDALARYRVQHVIGYPSSLHSISRAIGEGRGAHLGLKAVVTNAEPLYAHQRESIENAFACPVRETYGMVELVAGAGECAGGHSHLWPEMGVCEVRRADGLLARDGSGELIATSLLDADMPLIRYRVGDTVSLGVSNDGCECGRTLPLLHDVEGRCDDLLYSRDGRPVGRLDPVFKAGLRVAEAQIIQESVDLVRVQVVPTSGFGRADGRAIQRALCERLGNVVVVVEPVSSIPRTSNGKFRAVISRVDPDLRELKSSQSPVVAA